MTPATSQSGLSEVSLGQPAPDFVAGNLNGKAVSLKGLIGGRKALLVFYRGGWCPFCNQQLAAISRDHSRFQELNTTVVAVSCEEIEKGRELLQKLALPYVLLSDTQFEGIDRYGVRETNPSEQVKARGITSHSKPAAFIIDEEGVVRYAYVGKNAQDRPKNEDMLRVLGEIGRQRKPVLLQTKGRSDGTLPEVKAIHIVHATWCPHCHPTTVEPMMAAAEKLGIPCMSYDIDDPEQVKKADELVLKHGDWSEDYLVPQVFLEMGDGSIRHVLTGYSESVELTKRAVANLLKSPFFTKVVAHVN